MRSNFLGPLRLPRYLLLINPGHWQTHEQHPSTKLKANQQELQVKWKGIKHTQNEFPHRPLQSSDRLRVLLMTSSLNNMHREQLAPLSPIRDKIQSTVVNKIMTGKHTNWRIYLKILWASCDLWETGRRLSSSTGAKTLRTAGGMYGVIYVVINPSIVSNMEYISGVRSGLTRHWRRKSSSCFQSSLSMSTCLSSLPEIMVSLEHSKVVNWLLRKLSMWVSLIRIWFSCEDPAGPMGHVKSCAITQTLSFPA